VQHENHGQRLAGCGIARTAAGCWQRSIEPSRQTQRMTILAEQRQACLGRQGFVGRIQLEGQHGL